MKIRTGDDDMIQHRYRVSAKSALSQNTHTARSQPRLRVRRVVYHYTTLVIRVNIRPVTCRCCSSTFSHTLCAKSFRFWRQRKPPKRPNTPAEAGLEYFLSCYTGRRRRI